MLEELDALGEAVKYLKEGDSAVIPMWNGEVLGADLPAAVELVVAETEPGIQGDRVSGARKPATMETGVVVQVPLFIATALTFAIGVSPHLVLDGAIKAVQLLP